MKIEVGSFSYVIESDDDDNLEVKEMFANAVKKNEYLFQPKNKNHKVNAKYAKRVYERDTTNRRKTSVSYSYSGKGCRKTEEHVKSLQIEQKKWKGSIIYKRA